MKGFWLLLLLSNIGISVALAQDATVSANKHRFRIGDISDVTLQAKVPQGFDIIWPQFSDSLGPHFEISRRGPVDTIHDESNTGLTLRQIIGVTSFDTGNWRMPVFDFSFIKKSEKDTISIIPEALILRIEAVPVDTTLEIKDIRPIVEIPFDFSEYIPWMLGALALIALIVALIYLWLNRRKPVKVADPVRQIPAWEKAIISLNKIEEEKLWQAGQIKAYYSRISDTLRIFIEEHYKLPAMESTTGEIEVLLSNASIPEAQRNRILQVLNLADLVKFAKQNPLQSENIRSIELARAFVEEEVPKPNAGKEDSNA